MKRLPTYPCDLPHRTRSVLPESAQRVTRALGHAMQSGTLDAQLITTFRQQVAAMSSAALPRAWGDIQRLAQLYRADEASREPIEAQLSTHPDLGWLLLFHGDGFLRQAALEQLATEPRSEFEFSAIVYRLNDWVHPVRQAAEAYATRRFPATDAPIVAESAFFLLGHARLFQRWNPSGKALLEQALYQSEVLTHLKDTLLRPRTGPISHFLRQLLMRPDFDRHLPLLATEASLPSVRAIAMETLLASRAQWSTGYRREWVNKVYGISRRVPVIDSRPVSMHIDRSAYLAAAARDRSALVRRVAAEVLIANRHNATPAMNDLARQLQHDKSGGIRTRIDFYLRTRSKAPDAAHEPDHV